MFSVVLRRGYLIAGPRQDNDRITSRFDKKLLQKGSHIFFEVP